MKICVKGKFFVKNPLGAAFLEPKSFFSIFQNQIESNVLSESKTDPMVMLKDLEIQTNQENIILYSVKAGFSESTIKVYFSKTTLL